MTGFDRRAFRKARRDAGLTQHDLAEIIGVNKATVTRWELGHSRPQSSHQTLIDDWLRSIGSEGKGEEAVRDHLIQARHHLAAASRLMGDGERPLVSSDTELRAPP